MCGLQLNYDKHVIQEVWLWDCKIIYKKIHNTAMHKYFIIKDQNQVDLFFW